MAKIYGTGCIKTKLTGKERKYSAPQCKLPASYSYVNMMPPILDQGQTYKCVAYATTAYMDWRKNKKEGDNNGGQFSIDKLYSIRADKNTEGMTIKEALNYIYTTGLNNFKIPGYAIVPSEYYLKHALVTNGPCLAALPAYEENMNKNFWDGSTFCGGHCILIVGYTPEGYIIRNSWGRSYGKNGYYMVPNDKFSKFYEIWSIL